MLLTTSIDAARSAVPPAPTPPITTADHFKASLLAVVRSIVERLRDESVLENFPFLRSYLAEADAQHQMCADSNDKSAHLPLNILQQKAGLDSDAINVLLTIGLIEEDPRFGSLFEWAQPSSPGQQRPTAGLLTAWWRKEEDCSAIRTQLRHLREIGLVRLLNPEAPRIQWAFEVTPLLWDIVRGEEACVSSSWFEFHNLEALPVLSDLVLPQEIQDQTSALPFLLAAGEISSVVVRGPMHNGRKTLLYAMAREAGYCALAIKTQLLPNEECGTCIGTLAILLKAMPVFTYELGPGETVELPDLGAYDGPIGVALSRRGSIAGRRLQRALTFDLPLPSPVARRLLWTSALGSHDEAPAWTSRFRLTSGGIIRSANLAKAQALLGGRTEPSEQDVQLANRTLHQVLENQAVHLPACGGWEQIVASPETTTELRALENRCRYREDLPAHMGTALAAGVNGGVRALFSGPSGTGKTLAARVLASELQLDIYRVDLSAIVNKYIGETEKNLNQIFSRAEELDLILLLDEGDALLTNRTAVQSSVDRYANLETNFLLQRVESFEGILFITTNALARIDSAFQRRMDVVVEFRLPEPEERWRLWHLHLPSNHSVSHSWLEELAFRCNFSGGQIRNASLHACLLSLNNGAGITNADLEQAVQREYLKIGAVCPLRRNGRTR